MSQHAFLAPSSASVWVNCAGSAKMQHLYPEPADSPKATEGTGAHWFLKELVYGRPVALGQVAENGVTLDSEMENGVNLCHGVIADILQDPTVIRAVCEAPVAIPYVHEQNWGTPDFWAYRPGLLTIVDFKYGHAFVEVFENWQLMDYACGIIDELKIDGHADQFTQVEFIIVQPRSYHPDGQVRRWTITMSHLRGHFNQLRASAELAVRPDAPVTTGDHCKYCTASHVCKALQSDAMRGVDTSDESIPFELSEIQVGHELRSVQRAIGKLEMRERGLIEQAKSLLRNGAVVPFYQLEATKSRRIWIKSVPEIAAFGTMFGVDLLKPPEVVTPTQAKALKKLDPDLIDSYSGQSNGEIKLVPIDNLLVKKAFQS